MGNCLFSRFLNLCLLFFFILSATLTSAPPNSYVVPLCRAFSKDLFDANAQSYLAPTTKVANSVTNSAFYHSAYVPKKVNKPYFRISVNGMYGSVIEEMRSFTPQFPMQEFDLLTALGFVTSQDTAALLNYFLQTLLYQGVVVDKTIVPPASASTSLGKGDTYLTLPHEVMVELVKKHPAMPLILKQYPEAAEMIESTVASLPEHFTLYGGGDVTHLIAGVPQLEIGSLFGTELLIRFIPPIDLGQYIGKFHFWGIGLKHSLSQYFFEDENFDGNNTKRTAPAPVDIALQLVYQNTGLENTVGVTKANLEATGNIYNVNLSFSRNFDNMFELYTGIGYESIAIDGSYKYYLPHEMQISLGLLKQDPNNPDNWIKDPPEYPGDDQPQTSYVKVNENHIKWTVGANKNIGPITIYLDYSISKFNVFTGGLQYRF